MERQFRGSDLKFFNEQNKLWKKIIIMGFIHAYRGQCCHPLRAIMEFSIQVYNSFLVPVKTKFKRSTEILNEWSTGEISLRGRKDCIKINTKWQWHFCRRLHTSITHRSHVAMNYPRHLPVLSLSVQHPLNLLANLPDSNRPFGLLPLESNL